MNKQESDLKDDFLIPADSMEPADSMGKKIDRRSITSPINGRKGGCPTAVPSGYKPEYCERVIELGREGKSKAYMCAALGITRPTLAKWADKNPEFNDALELASLLSQQWWEDAGQVGMVGKTIDAAIWSRSMSARFRDDWADTRRVETTGKDGAPIEIANRVSVINEILSNINLISHQKDE
jgi:hypothetical protein